MTAFSPRALLVTGGAGFIGSTFVRQQAALGRKVVVLDALTYAGHEANLAGVPHELVVDTICNTSGVLELLKKHRIDAIVNFAAESHVDRSIDSPGAFIETNIRGTYSLLSAAHEYFSRERRGFRFVQISTDEV